MGLFQVRIKPPSADTSFAGKTMIVTGASDGLGLEATRQFARLGAHRIILACRSITKGEQQVSALQKDAQIQASKTQLEVFELDLDDYASVVRFAERVRAEVSELDVLLNNAGMNVLGYRVSKSGHERMMQVNAYSQFLLALELLPLLRATAAMRGVPSHLSFTSSMQYERHSLGSKPLAANETVLGHFDDRAKFSNLSRYPDTKMVVVAFVRELAKRTDPAEVVVNEFCPGFVSTNLDHELPPLLKYVGIGVRKLVARTVQEGARTLVHAAACTGQDSHGRHLKDNVPQTEPIAFFKQDAGKKFGEMLWSECMEEFKRVDPTLKTDL